MTASPELYVDYGDQSVLVQADQAFTIGREADLVLGDDPFLHRKFLVVDYRQDLWLVSNIGSRISATVVDPAARMEAFLGPGATLPLVSERLLVTFTTTTITYEIVLRNTGALFAPPVVEASVALSPTTLATGRLTDEQMLMLLSLAESRLRGTSRGSTVFPSSAEASERLGWSKKKFEKKIDNVCEKFDKLGVQGLRGGGLGLNAANRRARLVEYVVAMGIVQPEDLGLLDAHATSGRETLDGS